jgi:hypothetical protein
MSKLAQVKKTKIKEPPRICVYAPEGFGKTTLAADAPNPIFLDCNAGSGKLSVARYPFRPGQPREYVPESLTDIDEALNALLTEPHDFQTLVIDTAGDLETLIHKFILARDKPKSKDGVPGINAYGFGKGWEISLDELRARVLLADRIRMERGMTIVFLAHSVIKKFESPVSEPYDRYTMRMNEKAAGFLREWCDVVAFGCFEETTTDLLGDRVKGVSTGRRLLKVKREATHDAKSRYAMPDVIELPISNPWAPFAKAMSDAQDMTIEQLAEAMKAECVRIGDDITTAKANQYIAEANGDTAMLLRVLDKLRAKESAK